MRKVTHSLWQHLLYIEAHNEFSYLGRSNHYLSNIVGLFCLASFLHGPQNLDRRNLYSNLVQREIEEQVYADGGSFEASSGYHFLATQMFSTTYELMLAQNLHPGAGFTERLYKMYAFLAALADRQGFLPQIGDCDDGRVELLPDDISQMSSTQPECRHSLHVQSFLGMGQALFARDLGGTSEHEGWRTAAKLSAADRDSDHRCCVFPHSGIVVLQNEHAKLVFLAQPNGIRGRGSHTHNDKLSVLLSIEGKELLVDSGTGGYTRDAATRNYFRSTAAHNTILIDDQEQNRFSVDPASLFRMQNDAAVSAVECRNSDGFILESGHSGFRRLGVDHVRAVHLRSGTLITIEDKFAGGGEHTFEAFFHLPRGWEAILSEQNGRKVRCILNGACRAEMLWGAEAELRLNRRVGRISRAYGATQEATTLSVTGKAKFPFLLTTEISWNA